jgi:Sulfatase
VASLLDRTGHVDAKRYPHFAQLERTSTWFRNAYTIYDSTERAQPAIFDGDYPSEDKLPTSADHPNSIFTLLAKTHRLNVSEEATSVCPRDLCKSDNEEGSYLDRMRSLYDDLSTVYLHVIAPPDAEHDLPSVSENWGNFGGGGGGGSAGNAGAGDNPNTRSNLNRNRNKRFADWVANIKNEHRPALNFKHTLMPHVPWQYLPDSKQYRRTARDPIPGLSQESYKDPYQIDSLHQRHLLQTGFADYELGELFRRLKQQGLFDKSLIAVAADHGVAFDLGKRDRRTLTRANAEEIGPIPFFLKAPGQKKGRIDTTFAESVDILPTIFDVLNVNPKVRLDGHSAYSKVDRNRNRIRIFQRNTFKPIRFAIPEWQQRRKAVLDRKLSIFGDGSEGALRLFRIGPHQDLLFRRVSDLSVTPGSGTSVSFPQAGEFRHVDLRTPTVPVHVTGYLKGVPVGRDLAIAVNGRIAATPRSYHLATNNSSIFAAMVPEPYLHQGANRIDVYEITGPGTLRRVGGL